MKGQSFGINLPIGTDVSSRPLVGRNQEPLSCEFSEPPVWFRWKNKAQREMVVEGLALSHSLSCNLSSSCRLHGRSWHRLRLRYRCSFQGSRPYTSKFE